MGIKASLAQVYVSTEIDRPDINKNGAVDLADALIVLQFLTATDTALFIPAHMDVSGDGRIGLEELLHILSLTASP